MGIGEYPKDGTPVILVKLNGQTHVFTSIHTYTQTNTHSKFKYTYTHAYTHAYTETHREGREREGERRNINMRTEVGTCKGNICGKRAPHT